MNDTNDDLKFIETLYRRNYDAVFRLITSKLSQYAVRTCDASDLAQEVFVKAAQEVAMLRAHPNPDGWLFKVAYNQCRNYSRTQYRRGEELLESADVHPCAQDDFSVSTLRMSLEQTLSAQDYALLEAYCIKEHPPEKLCEEFGLSPVALRVRIHRLRKFLSNNFILLVTFALHQNI